MRPTQTTMAIAAIAAAALTLSACDRPEPVEPQASSARSGTQIAKPVEKYADDSASKSSADTTMNKSADATPTPMSGGRADDAITAKVTSALQTDPTLKAADIKVATREGTVTLTGTVDTTDMRMHAHQLAATTPGVSNVVDNLSVKNAG